MNKTEAMNKVINKLRQTAIVAAVAGAVIGLGAGIGNPTEFLHAYLYGYLFWLGLTIGFFGLQLLVNAVRSKWGKPILRITEAGGGPATLALMLVLILPILLGASHLYPWAQAEALRLSPDVRYRSGYMNLPSVAVRTVFWFSCWIFISYMLRVWSLRQDRTGEVQLGSMRTNLGAAGMVIFFLTVTLAMTDWVMSLEPNWTSTVFGALMIVGQTLNALAWTALLMSFWQRYSPYAEHLPAMETPLWNDLANLMLTNTMFWAYLMLSQFLIIWSGNLPDEVTYYAARSLNGWQVVSATLIIGEFFVPFLCLLAPRTKNPQLLRKVAVWIIAMRILDVFWVVTPSYGAHFLISFRYLVECAGAFLAIGGVWFAVFASQLGRGALVPDHVYPVEEEVLEHA